MELKSATERKPLGESQYFCPVALKETNILYPGKEELTVRFRERSYLLSTEEAKLKFTSNPNGYLNNNEPLQAPPLRLFILGPRFSGKTTVGSKLAQELGIFFISFHVWLQQVVMHKLYKKPPLVDEEDIEEHAVDNTQEATDNINTSEQMGSVTSLHSENKSKSELELQEKSTDESK